MFGRQMRRMRVCMETANRDRQNNLCSKKDFKPSCSARLQAGTVDARTNLSAVADERYNDLVRDAAGESGERV
jgi:hypothetical protein